MKLVFLASSKDDLRWFKQYYMNVFPEGSAKANNQFLALQKALKTNPYIGHPSVDVDGAREYPVLRTPFTFIYRINQGRIEIMRVIDNQSGWNLG